MRRVHGRRRLASTVSQKPVRPPTEGSPEQGRFQTQAVLRRTSKATPLVLVGITLDSTFYPGSPTEATGLLQLSKGLVALRR